MDAPSGVLLVTVGVDVQAKYLAMLTAGWSDENELWILDYEKTEGDPRDPAIWRALVGYLNAVRFGHPKGDMPVHLVGVDSGFLTDVVYAAVKLGNSQPGRSGRWWHATKGSGGLTGEPLVLPTRDERDAHGRRGLRPLRINTDEAKAEFMAMLGEAAQGPSFVHIPKRLGKGTDLLAELTSEEARTKFDSDGVVVGTEWKKRTSEARNEALDAVCICLALSRFVTKAQWLNLLVSRHGKLAGEDRFRARYPAESVK
jgi:phage terminase large subunit GpA-like protein